MTHLIIHAPDQGGDVTSETAFGGQPCAPQGQLQWPTCSSCEGNMQFLGQLRPDRSENLLLLFMCQNEPGACDEWDADSGGNKVVSVAAAALRRVHPPEPGEVLRTTQYGSRMVEDAESDYDLARTAWAKEHDVSPREVLGQLGGTPSWLQADETPSCDFCKKPMEFVAQLEEGPDWKTEMNFGGGGCAYVFRCACHAESAKLLSQC